MQMQTEVIETRSDEQIVDAVRRGNAEEYRQLVERYERRVYAVAWSRLGDANLAEDATQEAFIRGYRYLDWLHQGSKFGPWISSIARRVAINLGFRHRRELNKRERWALEQGPDETQAGIDESTELYTPETLRQALAELPHGHRECLVLFYLEGKSGAEAAAALGISETALRVRLHRARAALREHLEEKLEGSLEKLRPAKSVVPAVMGAILISSSAAKAATAGGTATVGVKLLSVVGKTALFGWMLPFISLIGALPGLAAAAWIGRIERRNYRETDGFRAGLHWGFLRSLFWGFPLMMVLIYVLLHASSVAWGTQGMFMFLGVFLAVLTSSAGRLLVIQRNPFQIGIFFYCLLITAGILGTALGWIPTHLSQVPTLIATALFTLLIKRRPIRMDYNLFLRAARGLLKIPARPETAPERNQFDRRALLQFARVLGSRWLAMNFRWEPHGLALRPFPVKSRLLINMNLALVPMSRNCSAVSLGWDGTVIARCSKRDESDLHAVQGVGPIDPRELERSVAAAVTEAWREFRSGNVPAAERILGELPESEIFLVSPARSPATRWMQLLLITSLALGVAGMTAMLWLPARFSGLKPVSITEPDVRAFLSNTKTNADSKVTLARVTTTPLFLGFVFPSTNLFTPDALRLMHKQLFRDSAFDPQDSRPGKATTFCSATTLHRAMVVGWMTLDDIQLTPKQVTDAVHAPSPYKNSPDEHFQSRSLLSRVSSWSWVKRERVENLSRIQLYGLVELRWLRQVNGLDVVNREQLIQQIASVQVLSAQAPPGQPNIQDWRAVRGLFFTPCSPALQDTYCSIAALEILGGLERIDREACVRGILRRHQGKGYFTSPHSGDYNEYHIEGNAQDTLCAFETLRILGALDRVNDLDRWQFRVHHSRSAEGILTWNDVEAWVCQQRFERFLRERKENPQSPPRSLLEP
jgi:RNA polymerase sigma factor (sigma-70 family)